VADTHAYFLNSRTTTGRSVKTHQIVNSFSVVVVLVLSATILNGCLYDIPKASTCAAYCPQTWEKKNEFTTTNWGDCGERFTPDVVTCLRNLPTCQSGADDPGENSCRERPTAQPSYVPNPTHTIGAPSTPTVTYKNVKFKLTKVNLAPSYLGRVADIVAAYPSRILTEADLLDGPLGGSATISYQRMLDLMFDFDFEMTTRSANTMLSSKFTSFTDDWENSGALVTAAAGVDPCGKSRPIRSLTRVVKSVLTTNPLVYDVKQEDDYGFGAFSQDPIVSSYRSSYSARTGKDFQVMVYFFDSKGVYQTQSADKSSCTEELITPLMASEWLENDDPAIKEYGLIYSELDQAFPPPTAPITHTFPIAVFMDILANPPLTVTDQCATMKDRIDRIVSHEIGHYVLTSGHDEKGGPTELMYPKTDCRATTQTIPFMSNTYDNVRDFVQVPHLGTWLNIWEP